MQAEILICKTCKIATNFKPTGTLLPHVKLTHLKKISDPLKPLLLTSILKLSEQTWTINSIKVLYMLLLLLAIPPKIYIGW